MHILWSRKEVTLQMMEQISELYEMVWDATCEECGRALTSGDYVDGLYPYEIDFNICWECLEKSRPKK